ncbi:hypothetical protein OE88DRAFT_1658 [Heliocybe sulcata]|uniref:HNH nuclease domain-containing protein n=1 Tax=Heliocybe sulcata TaxID=5364 RepID=A0A5C3NJL0_9AGAM|nr:hypothetical protein OE88DRAFT_1658 [Heliocybe sulcata]
MLLERTGPAPLHDRFSHPNETIAAAYHCCRDDEKEILQELEKTPGNSSLTIDLMNIRVIGHLIDLLSQHQEDQTRTRIAKMIMSCGAQEKRIEVGAFYNKYLIKTFHSNRGRTPAPSSHSSRSSFDFRQAVIKNELESKRDEYTYPKDHWQAKKWALVRDSYRCVATKRMEVRCEEDIPAGVLPTYTKCAHIFPESTNTNLDDSKKSEYAASVWTVLEAFGHGSIKEALNRKNIHHLDNILTVDPTVHIAFDQLWLWFEATGVPNCYKTTDERLALPNPTYLRLHALCCKVAHLSGAAEYYKQLGDDYDTLPHVISYHSSAH